MRAKAEELEILRELFPFIKIVDENHRLGVIVEIDKSTLKYNRNKYHYDWIHAGKYCPGLGKLVFVGIDEDCDVQIDNYCNIIEEGFAFDRGECTFIINDKKNIVEIYDLV
jgi:hypothetical protein